MISSNLTEFLQWLFQKNIPKFLIQRVESSKTLKPVLNNEVCTYSYRNLIHSKKCILHNNKNLLMKNSNVYENLINKVMPRTAFCTKSENRSCKPSPGRHEYHKETEDSVNNQIGAEFNAAFSYLSMACYFGRTEISLPGCQGFFTNMYEEELEHAMIFINHQLLRGGYVLLPTISLSHSQDWKSIKKAFATALEMEKSIKEKLVSLFDVAETHKDLQVMDIVSTQFMEEQNRSICELARLLKKAEMTDNPIGEYLFDKLLYNSFVKKSKDNLMYKKKLDDTSEAEVYK